MPARFDSYRDTVEQKVDESIHFSGLNVEFFTKAKVRWLKRLITRSFSNPERKSALDIGCGVGTIHPHLKSGIGKLAGVDISQSCIERAQALHPDVEYRTYDGARLPFADACFDLTYTICVMHHVPPASWPSFMAEMHRVTADGGIAIVIEHNPLNPLTRLAVNRCEFDDDAVLLRAGTARRLMAEAGFRDIACHYFPFVPIDREACRAVDDMLGFLPIGAQYIAFGRK